MSSHQLGVEQKVRVNTVQYRISMLISDLGLRVNSFAKEIGATQSTVQSIISKRRTSPGYETLHKIVSTKFRKEDQIVTIDANWLLLGEGDMYKIPTKDVADKDIEEKIQAIEARLRDLEK